MCKFLVCERGCTAATTHVCAGHVCASVCWCDWDVIAQTRSSMSAHKRGGWERGRKEREGTLLAFFLCFESASAESASEHTWCTHSVSLSRGGHTRMWTCDRVMLRYAPSLRSQRSEEARALRGHTIHKPSRGRSGHHVLSVDDTEHGAAVHTSPRPTAKG